MTFQLNGKKENRLYLLLMSAASVVFIYLSATGQFATSTMLIVYAGVIGSAFQKKYYEASVDGTTLTLRYMRFFFFTRTVHYAMNEIYVERYTENTMLRIFDRDYIALYRNNKQLEKLDSKVFDNADDLTALYKYCREA